MSKKKLVILLSRFPYPIEKGDKLRAYKQIQYLSNYFEIHLFALEESSFYNAYLHELIPYCAEIKVYKLTLVTKLWNSFLCLLRNEPVQVGYFYSKHIHATFIKDIQALKASIFYAQLSRTAKYMKGLTGNTVLDFQDAFSLNYQRMSMNFSGIKKWFYARESKCMAKYEQVIRNWFKQTIIISAFDAKAIHPNIRVVQNGVDTKKFVPLGLERKTDILFVGNLSYEPNKQAVQFLVQQILPLVRKQIPTCTVEIVGANMPYEIKAMQQENVRMLGWVDDLVEVYNSGKLMVAPMLSGAGLQNKVLEAMACGTTVIISSIVNESLQAEHEKEITIADSAVQFSESIITLLQHESKRNQLSGAARSFVVEKFNWDVENEKLRSILDVGNNLEIPAAE